MRPVVKGPAPQVEYRPYGAALDDLAEQLGLYCSYCEQPINHAPEIEHVQPKSLEPRLEYSWENFLLGCKSCNSVKGNTPVNPEAVAFPDMDNTFRALEFHTDGRITVSPGSDNATRSLMEALVQLVKLHRHPGATHQRDRPTPRDRRVHLRLDAWDTANYALQQYQQNPDIAVLIADKLAPAKGFFSIWMTVFADHPSMLRRFVAAFPGTDESCFDPHGRAVQRPGGRF